MSYNAAACFTKSLNWVAKATGSSPSEFERRSKKAFNTYTVELERGTEGIEG